ncbi:amidohydrolase family protein, partial [Candidatus Woesearchaeota archaeon]|nr:amidohydrolase family protein [Candidatus Woesearchaeota archaeon]
FHLAETEKEMKDFIKKEGKNPVRYLEEIGFLMPNLVSCHSVWLDNKNITAMKNHDVKIVHNPVSNMKLAVGKALPYAEMKKAGLCIALGTDGCASNNNLDMFQTMKFASLLQKFSTNTQTILPATEAVEMATRNGAVALGLNAGEIKEGKLADLLLIDLKKEYFAPNHNIVSNIAYAAHPDCVNTVICDGKVLMENRKVEGEEEIIMKATEAARKLAEK